MISNARGSHSSPGIYTKEVDLTYAAKSLGITTLGVVGETLKGPAFEPIKIENWREYQQYFGGTSAEKFKGSKYPKYELPYIAKSYLKNSNQLEVCRVLGLSGYNAGPAWLITAEHGEKEGKYVVAVLRSRGAYDKYGNKNYDPCDTDFTYDKLTYFAERVKLEEYCSAAIMIDCTGVTNDGAMEFAINENNFGRFTLVINEGSENEQRFPVSLNPEDKDYILNVLGTSVDDGDAFVFVEELYDVALTKMIYDKKVTVISNTVVKVVDGLNDDNSTPSVPTKEAVLSFKDIPEYELSYKNLGQRFIDVVSEKWAWNKTDKSWYKPEIELSDNEKKDTETYSIDNRFFSNVNTVTTTIENGKRIYQYEVVETLEENERIFVMSEDRFFEFNGKEIVECSTDVNDYKEQFRCASTPWVVSELKGDGKQVQLRKLFRFHTISDGNAANSEVKVSIQNILPDEGYFDVVVRAFDDMDSNPTVLEKFSKCSMVPGTANFIGLKIGTFDGEYELKSKYITVEVITNDMTESCVPAGFLGYPMREYAEKYEVKQPSMGYNVTMDDDIKVKKQYFGFSNLTGIDVDLLKYKGRNAYDNINSLSDGFHLDSRVGNLKEFLDGLYENSQTGVTKNIEFTVDGEKGYKFITVNPNVTTGVRGGSIPVIGQEREMANTIYKDVVARKFTVCFYGGFDGWDIYRESRTNTDEYKANKYMGVITNGNGSIFNQIMNPDGLNLSGNAITTDYYAYLAGIKQFMNPEAVDINVFATPGIDYVNNSLLSQEALTMIEEDRGDAIYVMTTPDKPYGNDDSDMYYPADVVANLEESEIDSSYATTYYPWVKFYDKDNKVYINLPATKDVVTSMAYTDNTSYPWFAPAGIIRGGVECERAHFITKLDDEDTLYEGRINPIKTFAADGVKIWGQKTMYEGDTPLNRVNVRRLMLRIKKLITGACRRLIFEQNDATVKAQFEGLVKPILDDIKAKRGIYDYRLEVDDSPEARDRQALPAAIYLKPTKSLEYIELTFTIMPESAQFNE